MAVETVKSSHITNRDADPRVKTNARVAKMAMQMAAGTCAASAASSVGSKYILCQIPSNARVSQVLLSCDASGATGTTDIGIYQTTANGGAVVDADHFASAVVITSALKNSDVTFESGVYGVEDIEKPLWEALGLSVDPQRDYDVVATITAIHADGGDISLQLSYGI